MWNPLYICGVPCCGGGGTLDPSYLVCALVVKEYQRRGLHCPLPRTPTPRPYLNVMCGTLLRWWWGPADRDRRPVSLLRTAPLPTQTPFYSPQTLTATNWEGSPHTLRTGHTVPWHTGKSSWCSFKDLNFLPPPIPMNNVHTISI